MYNRLKDCDGIRQISLKMFVKNKKLFKCSRLLRSGLLFINRASRIFAKYFDELFYKTVNRSICINFSFRTRFMLLQMILSGTFLLLLRFKYTCALMTKCLDDIATYVLPESHRHVIQYMNLDIKCKGACDLFPTLYGPHFNI